LALDGSERSASRPAALPPVKSPGYPLDRRLGGLQSRVGRGGEGKNMPVPAENRNPVVQPVAYSLYYAKNM
jgi:hypothetical protein